MWGKYLKLPEFLRISGSGVEKTLMSFNLKNDSNILDIGCAYGRISLFMKKQGYDGLAIDNNKQMAKLTKDLGIRIVLMDATKLGIKKNSFDLVLTDGLLEHFENPNNILCEENRVAKEYVLNFIPKNTKINKVLEVIQKTPKVYWRSKKKWLQIHKKYFKKIHTKSLLRLEAYICEK
jgi:ubiquinone/menaquinone biosynthesis C-methylase UbiE